MNEQQLRKQFKTWFDSDKDQWDSYTVEDTEKACEEIADHWINILKKKEKRQREEIERIKEMEKNSGGELFVANEGSSGVYNDALIEVLSLPSLNEFENI